MKMIFLLVSAAALLFSSVEPRHTAEKSLNLNQIIDLALQYNKSLHKEFFVEDVSDLAETTACNNTFYCKVYDILHKHENFTKWKVEDKIVKNLKMYITGKQENCTVLIKDLPAPVRLAQLPQLMEVLVKCIQTVNSRV